MSEESPFYEVDTPKNSKEKIELVETLEVRVECVNADMLLQFADKLAKILRSPHSQVKFSPDRGVYRIYWVLKSNSLGGE